MAHCSIPSILFGWFSPQREFRPFIAIAFKLFVQIHSPSLCKFVPLNQYDDDAFVTFFTCSYSCNDCMLADRMPFLAHSATAKYQSPWIACEKSDDCQHFTIVECTGVASPCLEELGIAFLHGLRRSRGRQPRIPGTVAGGTWRGGCEAGNRCNVRYVGRTTWRMPVYECYPICDNFNSIWFACHFLWDYKLSQRTLFRRNLVKSIFLLKVEPIIWKQQKILVFIFACVKIRRLSIPELASLPRQYLITYLEIKGAQNMCMNFCITCWCTNCNLLVHDSLNYYAR